MRRRSNRGSTLILVLGVLALFSLLVLSFVALMRIERRASANYLDEERARLVAEGGLHRALAELSHSELRDPCSSPMAHWRYGSLGVPLAHALAPSYSRGVDWLGASSGILGGTYITGGDRYVLKVIDTTAKLDLRADPAFLGPALDALGIAIEREDARAHDPIAGRGARVAAFFASRGSDAHLNDLTNLLGVEDARKVVDYVTLHARRDAMSMAFRGRRDARGIPVPEADPRAPVCVNTAPVPVLVAVFANVTGRDGLPVTTRQALVVADRLDAWRRSRDVDRGPVRTWNAFLRFAESELPACGLTPGQREALLANASPFLAAAEANPDSAQLTLGSRTCVRQGTTEFSLLTSGDYEITSLGRVYGPQGGIVAESTIAVLANIFSTERHRSQADFQRGGGEHTVSPPALGDECQSRYGWVQLTPSTLSEPSTYSWHFADPGITGTKKGNGGQGTCGNGQYDQTGQYDKTGGPHGAPACSRPGLRGNPLEPRGPIHHDGYRLLPGAPAVVMQLGRDAPAESGRLGLWIKLASDTAPGLLLELTVELSANEGVRQRIEVGLRGDDLFVASERQLLCNRETSVAPSAFRVGRSRAQATPLPPGRAHEWHWIEIVWEHATEQTLWVDGCRYSDDRLPASLPDVREAAPFANMIALGGTVGGTPSKVDATVDGLLLDTKNVGGSMPDRYWGEARIVGTFNNAFTLSSTHRRLGTISWTAFRPRRWGRVEFRPDEFTILAFVEGKSVGPLGEGQPMPTTTDEEDDADAWEAPESEPATAPGGTAPSSPAPGSASNPSGLGSSSTTGSTPAGVGSLMYAGSSGAPRVVKLGKARLAYQFAFIYDREALAERGIEPPPLALTPVLAEVVITYSRGATIEHIEDVDE